MIDQQAFEKAYELTKDVAEFDTPFVAFALELDAPLWTGDKKLKKGLSEKGIDWVLSTDIVTQIRNAK